MEERFSDQAQILARLKNTVVGKDVCNEAPEISVIIPVFDIAHVIAETLESVFSQSFENYEVVVVNDGSNDIDDLKKALVPYRSRLVYADQENAGASAARNSAMSLARGAYFAFLDGDDVWYENFLASQISFLKKNHFDMVYCDADLFSNLQHIHGTSMAKAPSQGDVTAISLVSSKCNVITSGTILKRSRLERSGLFDLAAKRGQDFDLWVRLALSGAKIGYQKEALLRYRVSTSGLTGTYVETCERSVSILNFVKKKYNFSAPELVALERNLAKCTVRLELEKAKKCLVEEEFEAAALHLRNACQRNRTIKTTLYAVFVNLTPRLMLKIFKIFRSNEYQFITPKQE